MKNVLIINGHPDRESFNHALANAYFQGLSKTDVKISRIDIGSLQFNPSLQFGYRKRMELEPDLKASVELIQKADHLVWFFPVWWYGYPAIMKGFIDRVFLPGITYENIPGKPLPNKLLKGKTGHIIVTADTPGWYHWLVMKRPAINQFKKGTLQFCGISPVKVTYIAVMKNSTDSFRKKWLQRIRLSGESVQ
ncbi:NAD(P)H-dependent oxidoreductase [Pseudoflavitalea sp. G-6-1-2]|uniref:NAD(P)H-dependent oxidoreductase n=1 Tax=Pseudoflavitalea sp. G-6-1-2 TaxID=2728841 RepID=UPI00146DC969|nr:NAD(P)H-dependent oxidoreductase [Pseudoflavitalea sp. G-6-1-2]NML23573.1 NAD(P)H-dependent oxidoreductase [Pseudoflavitalea sp. G-6-1-2]